MQERAELNTRGTKRLSPTKERIHQNKASSLRPAQEVRSPRNGSPVRRLRAPSPSRAPVAAGGMATSSSTPLTVLARGRAGKSITEVQAAHPSQRARGSRRPHRSQGSWGSAPARRALWTRSPVSRCTGRARVGCSIGRCHFRDRLRDLVLGDPPSRGDHCSYRSTHSTRPRRAPC